MVEAVDAFLKDARSYGTITGSIRISVLVSGVQISYYALKASWEEFMEDPMKWQTANSSAKLKQREKMERGGFMQPAVPPEAEPRRGLKRRAASMR